MSARNSQRSVLAAAIVMFSQRGYARTSMRDLGAELGVSARALYRHFDDKDELFLAATAPLLDAIDAMIASPPTSEPVDRLRWLTAYTEALRADIAIARIVGAETAWPNHKTVGPRAQAQDAKVRRILAGEDSDADARGTAALGLLWWPLLRLHQLPDESAEHAARRALKVAKPATRTRESVS